MKILNQEHSENVKRYAESIGDTSLQKCLERLKSWEENPDYPSEISLYYDHAPYSFGFTQLTPGVSTINDLQEEMGKKDGEASVNNKKFTALYTAQTSLDFKDNGFIHLVADNNTLSYFS